jgi:hypothetical protein
MRIPNYERIKKNELFTFNIRNGGIKLEEDQLIYKPCLANYTCSRLGLESYA